MASANRSTCSVDACGKPAKCRGLCVTHYQRQRATDRSDLQPPTPQMPYRVEHNATVYFKSRVDDDSALLVGIQGFDIDDRHLAVEEADIVGHEGRATVWRCRCNDGSIAFLKRDWNTQRWDLILQLPALKTRGHLVLVHDASLQRREVVAHG